MKPMFRLSALALALTLGVGIVSIPVAARASEEGKRNTAIGLGAAAAALLLTQKNKLPGILAAAGAAYAYTQYDDAIQDRHRREREYGYDGNDGYRYHESSGYRNGNYPRDDNYRNGSNRDDYRDGYHHSDYQGDHNGYGDNGNADCRNSRYRRHSDNYRDDAYYSRAAARLNRSRAQRR